MGLLMMTKISTPGIFLALNKTSQTERIELNLIEQSIYKLISTEIICSFFLIDDQ